MRNLKKMLLLPFLAMFIFIACSSGDDGVIDVQEEQEEETETADTNYDISSILSKFSGTGLSYEVNGSTVTFTTQDLPNHKSPYWPTGNALYEAYNGTNSSWNQNPNEIAAQNIVFTITLNPKEATNKAATQMGPIGISRNGVVFFNQYAAGGAALTGEINSFDQYLGHPTGRDQYHYHIEPTYLTGEFGDDAFLGLLSDGFPVYGPMENGSIITNDDLDDYHGHTSVTPDFPNGIYHYHITSNDPYINGNGFYGTAGNVSN